MRKFLLLSFTVISVITAAAQDFSNKGKDFWITSGWHYGMGTGNPPVMTLSLTSDVNTTYSIEAYGVGVIASGNITANLVTIVNIPSIYFTYVPGAGTGDGLFIGKAIHVTAVKPIVIYSFTTQSLSSAATLCLPTNVLGKQYYAASYTQRSANSTGNNFITIIAVEDNTSVEIIPTQSTAGGWTPNSVNIVNLNKGEIYQVLGAMTGNIGSDLTGTSIRSIASGSGGCKKIAVFSGSGRLWLGAGCNNGADNLYQQLYPATTWGRKYLTVPSSGRLTNYYRIIRPAGATSATVSLNGAVIPSTSFINNFYEFNNTIPNLIEADTSICVAQYFTSAGCIAGNGNPYDPDMVILNPVEQNISDVTLISSDRLNHTPTTPQHYIHVIMRNGGTGISTFRFDGGTIPPGSFWVTHPRDPNYSYLYLNNVSETYHSLKSDSGFNAIAYGYANFETYAYSAGTNVIDFYQQIGVSTQYGIETTPSVCTNSPFRFKVSLPYCADSIRWDLSNLPGPPVPPIDTVRYTTCVPGAGGPDSTTVVNGVTLYWYSLPSLFSFSTAGVYPVTITTYAPNSSGCGSEQLIDFDLTVSDPPFGDFTWTPGGCVATPYQFIESTPQLPKPTYRWYWNFGDPGSGAANTSTLRNPTHLFSAPGTYTVKYAAYTTPGCVVDTITKTTIVVPDLPNATIAGNTTVCINAPQPFVTFTGTLGTPEYTFNYNINGGATLTSPASVGGIVSIPAPTNVAGPFVYNLVSVRNVGAAACTRNITGQSVTVNITPDATVTLTSAAGTNNQTVCINNPLINITYAVGGSGTGGSVTGLPAGVTGVFAAGVITISGTPTVSGSFPYTVNTTGPCVTPTAVGTINVTADATIN
ncbi:MAG: PKD domain-containing protein, partial [Ferruginibacter sp.]